MPFDSTGAAPGSPDPQETPAIQSGRRAERILSALEVSLCSGYPTQLGLVYILGVSGLAPTGEASMTSVAFLLLLDSAVVLALVVWFLTRRQESLGSVFLGWRPAGREALLGLPLSLIVFVVATTTLVTIQHLAPELRNVAENPLERLLHTDRDAALFAFVAIVAGGLREEVQRAFILHRFREDLGGATVGLVVFSIAFGAGHALQGWDAAITTGLLGAFWGILYLRRGSVVAPVVSHAGFNTLEIIQLVFGRG